MPVNPSPQIWPANSTLDLVNVPWDNAYRSVVRFPNRGALDTYIDSVAGSTTQPGKKITGMSYLRADQPILLEDPFNNFWQYNYVRVSNPPQPVEEGEAEQPRSFYYFITGVRHVAPNTTEITVQLDVYQTFIYDANFGESFVERSHAAVANADQMGDNGRRLLTAPEGLDTGDRLETVGVQNVVDGLISPALGTDFIVYSTSDLASENWGTPDAPNTPGPAGIGDAFGVASGMSIYVISTAENLAAFLNRLVDYPWIAQTIVKIAVVPLLTTFYPSYSYPQARYELRTPPTGAPNLSITQVMPGAWRDDNMIERLIPARYAHLNKFKVWPYLAIELDYNSGNSLTLKPELFRTQGVHAGLELSANLADSQMKVYPMRYGITGGSTDNSGFDVTHSLDEYVTTGQLPSLGVANDMAALTLASTAYSRSFQSDNADFTRDLANRQAARSYDSVTAGVESAREATRLGNQFASSQQAQAAGWATDDAWRNGIVGTAQSAASGAIGGVPGLIGGAVAGAASGALQGWQTSINNERGALTTAQQNAQNSALTENAVSNQLFDRDENRALANFAAKGNYEQTISSIQASVNDTKTVGPSMVAQSQGSLSAMARNELVPRLTIKFLGQRRIAAIGDYWLRYGYAIGEYFTPPPHGHTMQRFTYWKMAECTFVNTFIPENYKNALRGIFEKGVTIWRDPAEIGDTSSANAPIVERYYG